MKVDVYGADHSPWVQAVLLGLREKGIELKYTFYRRSPSSENGAY